MKRKRQSPPLTTVLLALGMAITAIAAPRHDETPESKAYLHSYNVPSSGLALEGYCPVAYFAANKPVKGSPDYPSEYNGITYHFISEDARNAFEQDPEKYLPAFGGWCAFGMAKQDKFPIDPTNFKIVDGQLMVFLKNTNVDARLLWNQGDKNQMLKAANAHWNKVAN